MTGHSKPLERRLHTLHLLKRELEECLTALVALDLNRIHEHTANQESLCAELRFQQKESSNGAGPALGAEPESEPVRILRAKVAAEELEVRRLNQVENALLRRSRRSVNVLLSFLSSYAATYAAPRMISAWMPAPGTGAAVRV